MVAALLALTVSCSGESSSDPVSVVRMRQGDVVNGECRFTEDISQYPVTYSTNPEDCWQAVRIGPLSLDELERMKQDVPLFWEKSSPYQYGLAGEWIDGACNFDTPAVQAFLEFSEIVSTDRTNCHMIIDMGPATQKQLDEIQRLGATESETAVPGATERIPGQ